MLFRDRGWQRGVELGPYPLEALPLDKSAQFSSSSQPQPNLAGNTPPKENPLATIADWYTKLYLSCNDSAPQPRGDVSDDLGTRSKEIKGAAYYLDASHVGICANPTPQASDLCFAIVIWVEYGRQIPADNALHALAHNWTRGAEHAVARMRAVEIGVSLMGHIRALGFAAECGIPDQPLFDCKTPSKLTDDQTIPAQHLINPAQADTWALQAGIAVQDKQGHAISPFFADRYAACIVQTDYALSTDTPLRAPAKPPGIRHWFGLNGAVSGRERNRRAQRQPDLSIYPMETVRRVSKPTTLIHDDEVPRVPKRAEFFTRARAGDLGAKAQREVARFAFKHPLTAGMMHPLRAMVPYQDGEVPYQDGEVPHQDGAVANTASALFDPITNTRAIKALSYHLGADLTGICEIPDYAWYSHNAQGTPITTGHRYAIVMLIDQGFDTMEGASGDDWISGCQSMRGYLRGAQIAGVMAQFLREQGVRTRAHTNADSEVLHIPLILLSGLGELSRIGELVLNPFVGPRFKSVVVTTDLPLQPDEPIDFGLQHFCNQCKKCARECPVNAIPFGNKVMFNGYEIWKPDVERCTRYRITNPKGSACGRCMKTCPLNKKTGLDAALSHRIGNWLGIKAQWLKPVTTPLAVKWDDRLGYGTRNPVKRWWQDLEIVDGIARTPTQTNERDLDLTADTSGLKSPVGYYHASDMPGPEAQEPVATNHKLAVARAAQIESVQAAIERRAKGGPRPAHYIPVADISDNT